jgi:hypothetical protein
MSNSYKVFSKKLRKAVMVRASSPFEALQIALNGNSVIIERGDIRHFDFSVVQKEGEQEIRYYIVERNQNKQSQRPKMVEGIIEISERDLRIMNNILNGCTEYDNVPHNFLKRTVKLSDGVFASIQLVTNVGTKPYTVGMLFVNYNRVICTEPSECIEGVWWFWYNGVAYKVDVVGM